MMDEHRLSLSINVEEDTLSVVDTITNTCLSMQGNTVRGTGIDTELLISHVQQLQLLLNDKSYVRKIDLNLFANPSPNLVIVEGADNTTIKYKKEKAIYKDKVLQASPGFDPTYVCAAVAKIYQKALVAHDSTLSSAAYFVHDLLYDLLICRIDSHQIVAAWSQIHDGFVRGALIDGCPVPFLIILPNTEHTAVTVFDNTSQTLFDIPYDKSADILFKEKGDPNEYRLAI